jgi:hypothetical protein
MAYIINITNGTQLTVVEDGTIDQTTDLKLVGKNYAGYGEIQNENFVALLENFSSAQSPGRPLAGQIWFDSANSKLKFYDGTKFRTTGGAEVSATQPAGLTEGDFWWDNANKQLYANTDDGGFILIGPQSSGDTVSQIVTSEVRDTQGINRTILASVVNDETIAITSSVQFTIDATDPENAILGFDVVRQGITLRNTTDVTDGVTSSTHRFWGTATNALKLGGVSAAEFVRSTPGVEAVFTDTARFSDNGFTVGLSNDLVVKIVDEDGDTGGNEGYIYNSVGDKIRFAVTSLGSETEIFQIDGTGLVPNSTTTYNLGSATFKWDTVHASSFSGLATEATAIKFNGTAYAGSTSATANTTALRDASGNITANLFDGTATQAQYADLAEKYTTEDEYSVGTVVAVCEHEEHEMALATPASVVAGVISEKPAYLMNADADGQAVALKGRVPVRIIGAVNKGDKVFVDQNGLASTEGQGDLVGIALETNKESQEKLVECFLKV